MKETEINTKSSAIPKKNYEWRDRPDILPVISVIFEEEKPDANFRAGKMITVWRENVICSQFTGSS